MAKATVVTYRDRLQGEEVKYLLIDNGYIVDDAVKDIVGRSLVNQTLHDSFLEDGRKNLSLVRK